MVITRRPMEIARKRDDISNQLCTIATGNTADLLLSCQSDLFEMAEIVDRHRDRELHQHVE